MLQKILDFLNFLYRLLIVNTLQKVQDKFDIHGLVTGTIVGVFGLIFALAGEYIFVRAGLADSFIIARLGVFAYLSILLYHMIEYEKSKWPIKGMVKRLFSTGMVAVSYIIMFALYLLLIDHAIYITKYFTAARAMYGIGATFLNALPGIVFLAIPVFIWEPLCRVTPVDTYVRKMYGRGEHAAE